MLMFLVIYIDIAFFDFFGVLKILEINFDGFCLFIYLWVFEAKSFFLLSHFFSFGGCNE